MTRVGLPLDKLRMVQQRSCMQVCSFRRTHIHTHTHTHTHTHRYDPNPTEGLPRGEILIRGPGLFKGYYRAEGMTKDVMGETAGICLLRAMCRMYQEIQTWF